MTFVDALGAGDLWDGDMTAATVRGRKVVLLSVDGTVYAYEDACAHLGVAVSGGVLDGDVLTCRAHHWQYDARSGQGVNPASACLRRFPVKVEGGRIMVDVDHPLGRP